ncbi:MAG: Ig-like domain-containing protein [Gemmatimonadaceae bacterium]
MRAVPTALPVVTHLVAFLALHAWELTADGFPTQLKPVVRFIGTIMNRKLLVLAATVFAFCSTLSCSDRSSKITGIALNDSTAHDARAAAVAVKPSAVTDLQASATGSSSVTLSFTQVDDGTGQPAKYDVRYAVAPIQWGAATSTTSGTCTTPVAGTAIGSQLSCTVLGLTPAANYNFQLVAFRGTMSLNAVYGPLSNIVSATTTASAPPPPVPVASVSVSPASSNLLIGATVQLLVTARDANDSVLTGRVVTSSSADAAIASVNSLGLVTAVSTGTTQITVTSEGKSAIATITVTATAPPPVKPSAVTDLQASATGSSSVTLSFTQVNDGAGQPAKYDVRYAVAPIQWGAATSATSGTCTTPVAGTAIGSQLSCTVLGLTPSTNYNFQLVAFRGTMSLNAVYGPLSNIVSATTTASAPPPPVPVASVSVSPTSSSLLVGATAQLSAVTRDASNNVLTGRVITWKSSNSAVSTVGSSGLVTAVAAGNATITATSETKTGTAAIIVSTPAPAPVATVSVSPASSSLIVGATVQVSATLRDAGNNVLTGRVVTWASANPSIASVNSTGLVSAVGAGSTTITATSETKTGTATENVQASPPPPPPGGTLLFEEDFENASIASRGWYDNTSVLLSTTEHIAGSVSSAQYHFLPGATTPTTGGSQRHKFTPSNSFYLSYYVKYSANWVGSGDADHPHEFYTLSTLDGDWDGPSNNFLDVYVEHNYQNGGRPRIEIQDNKSVNLSYGAVPNNLIGVTENRSDGGCNGVVETNLYHECFNQGTYWYNDKQITGPVAFQPNPGPGYKNNWNFVEAYFQLNTIVNGIGQANGVVRYWFNGALIIDRHDILFRTGAHPTLQFNQFLIAPYIGVGSPVDQSMWVDNLRIATARIP